jgi:two-component system LytT family sensor kinase
MWKSLVNREWWRNVALIFAFYTFLTLLFLPQIYFYNSSSARPESWLVVIGRLALAHYLWAFLTPMVFWFGERLAIERGKIVRNLVAHFVLSLIFAAVQTFAYHLILGFIYQDAFAGVSRLMGNPGYFLNLVTNGFVIYVGILALGHAAVYARKYRDREFRLQQAELQALKMQLHPHFLFNTLNAISALVYSAPKDAVLTISQLSDLLRLTLQSNKTQKITLKEELDFLRKYVQIQETLLAERLAVEWKIEPETLDAAIPNMLLQPLVENSIRHGIAPLEAGGRIMIRTRLVNEKLFIYVRDNGLGITSPDEKRDSHGVGLDNTRARLSHLYSESHEFKLSEHPEGGLLVTIAIPFQEKISDARKI